MSISTSSRQPRTAPDGSRPARRRRVRPWWRDALSGISGASVAFVVLLWVHGGGLTDLAGGSGATLTSLSRLSGLVGSDLLLLQVLLMARIPWAERTWGQDTLARWHRLLGFSSFTLVVVHIVTIVLGYAATDHTGVLAETWSLVSTYAGMLLATAGFACLVMVVVTSVRAARRRLRYESWHLMHLYAYLGVGLALPHQLWTGGDFVASPTATVYWWTLWALATAAVLVYRVGVPVQRNLRHRLTVVAVVPEAPGVVSVHLKGRHLDRLGASAGQFLLVRFLNGPGWSRAHPYSLSAAPHPTMLRLTVKALGDDSARVAGLQPGTRVLFEGPLGALTAHSREDPSRGVTLLGSGVGITPLRALLEELDAPAGDTVLVHRARTADDLIFRQELTLLAEHKQARVVPVLGRRGRSDSWLPQELGGESDAAVLRRISPRIARHDVYICGPDAWMDAAHAAALACGVPPEKVHLERFSW